MDTSIVVAAMNRRDDHHPTVVGWLGSVEAALVTSPLALAEMHYLITRHGGAAAAQLLYDDFDAGAYGVEWWPTRSTTPSRLHREHPGVGRADASLVAIAGRLGTAEIATLDERRFRPLRPLTGQPAFRILPTDAD